MSDNKKANSTNPLSKEAIEQCIATLQQLNNQSEYIFGLDESIRIELMLSLIHI